MMQDNGSVSNNVKYKNICKEQFPVHIAYNNRIFWFQMENNSMVDSMKKFQVLHGLLVGGYDVITLDTEILSLFFKNYNIILKWINCNGTWGVFDDETGKWTGAVGQVNMNNDIS